ncbi:hypothetical protein TSOC_000171 [Tetrabaena socialis]|uniref:Uncharacterized protein n=1 Tax=Tetrabaena socialis TaxID=47790 RepID=A0A2J8AJZ3_9CHLO|nr:hypothetical protein TSOC_000171 [Tetrabaena socialis]|eukprot:PNH12844.1 hypothetical protein TSOC_000171 [Tetrabaena socialis]
MQAPRMSGPSASAMMVQRKRPQQPDAAACGVKKVKAELAPSLPALAHGGLAGWTYPTVLPPTMPIGMPFGGMASPMFSPACNPFFPFMGMGMFPPFWMPTAAMAATLPAAMAASVALSAGTSTMPAMGTVPTSVPCAMWPGMMPCAMAMAGASAAPSVSGVAVFPTTSCTSSEPTAVGFTSPASPSLAAASPVSVCNASSEHQPEDDEFVNFIDSFLSGGDSECAEGMAVFQKAGPASSGSNSSEDTTDEEPCLTRSDSLMNLLGEDFDLRQ